MRYDIEIDDQAGYSVVTLPGHYTLEHWSQVLASRADDGHTEQLTLEPVAEDEDADTVTYIFYRPDDDGIAEMAAIQEALDRGATEDAL